MNNYMSDLRAIEREARKLRMYRCATVILALTVLALLFGVHP